MKQIRSETTINVPVQHVRSVLCDFGTYQDWNPFIIRASGRPEVGALVEVTSLTPAGKRIHFGPQIREVVQRGRII